MKCKLTFFTLCGLPVFRCHSGHESCPIGSGGRDGLAPSPAPIWPRSRGLPPATREQIHLEEGVSGCYGEVRRRCWLAVENIEIMIFSIKLNQILKHAFTKRLTCVFTATLVITNTLMKRRERRSPLPAMPSFRNQVGKGWSTLNKMITHSLLLAVKCGFFLIKPKTYVWDRLLRQTAT